MCWHGLSKPPSYTCVNIFLSGQSSMHQPYPIARCENDREMKRRMRVWERKCRDDTPLLSEWVPPTKKQLRLVRSLGSARAWVEILLVQKVRYGGVW